MAFSIHAWSFVSSVEPRQRGVTAVESYMIGSYTQRSTTLYLPPPIPWTKAINSDSVCPRDLASSPSSSTDIRIAFAFSFLFASDISTLSPPPLRSRISCRPMTVGATLVICRAAMCLRFWKLLRPQSAPCMLF